MEFLDYVCAKYFEELLNCEESEIKFFTFDLGNINDRECSEPTLEDIELQINNLKNNKYPGEYGFQAELLEKIRRGHATMYLASDFF